MCDGNVELLATRKSFNVANPMSCEHFVEISFKDLDVGKILIATWPNTAWLHKAVRSSVREINSKPQH